MDSKSLKRWKELELDKAECLASALRSPRAEDIGQMYPEFALRGSVTNSLEPYVPLWSLVPFFEKIIVGIVPYLRTEEEFHSWYGLSIRDVLALQEQGHLLIRMLFPSAAPVTPTVLAPFFSGNTPSTARDIAFDRRLLGSDRFEDLRQRFARVVGQSYGHRSIDGFQKHRRRAFKTAQTAFVQLHALNYGEQAAGFEDMWKKNPDSAFRWLEMCRLFLVGPIHYSLRGIHCVSSAVTALAPPAAKDSIRFPGELGRILVDALRLVRFEEKQEAFTLKDCVSLFPDFELARKTLLALNEAIGRGDETHILRNADDLRRIIVEARSKRSRWLRWLRIAASTGVGIAAAPFNPAVGLLAGLGFAVTTEFANERIDAALSPVAKTLQGKRNRHLSLLIDLDDAARRLFHDNS